MNVIVIVIIRIIVIIIAIIIMIIRIIITKGMKSANEDLSFIAVIIRNFLIYIGSFSTRIF